MHRQKQPQPIYLWKNQRRPIVETPFMDTSLGTRFPNTGQCLDCLSVLELSDIGLAEKHAMGISCLLLCCERTLKMVEHR